MLQQLDLRWLLGMTLVTVVSACVFAKARFLRLLRRSRFLLLALFLIYAVATPGERLPYLPDWLPLRREACELALQHILGLIALLASLAVLLERMSLERLIAGLYSVSLPLALIGVARDRAALRLLLVLDGLQRKPALGWRDWLTPEPAPEAGAVRIDRDAWHATDYSLLVLMGVAAVLIVKYA
jgi:hypothetical protein